MPPLKATICWITFSSKNSSQRYSRSSMKIWTEYSVYSKFENSLVEGTLARCCAAILVCSRCQRSQIPRPDRVPRCLTGVRQSPVKLCVWWLHLDLRFQQADHALRVAGFRQSLADGQQ